MDQIESSSKGNYRGGKTFNKGKGGRGNGTLKCYNYNQLGHHVSKCPEKRNNNQGEIRAQLVQEDTSKREAKEGIVDDEAGLLTYSTYLGATPKEEPIQNKG